MTSGELIETIKRIAPGDVNSIIIDSAVPIKQYNYCYIEAITQKVEYKSEQRSAAVGDDLAQSIIDISHRTSDSPFVRLDNRDIIDLMEQAPRYSTETFLSSAKKRVEELKNGGRSIDHSHITLNSEDGRLSKHQPLFVVKRECKVVDCPTCHASGLVEHIDKQGIAEQTVCGTCKGYRHIGTLSYLVPSVSEKRVKMIRCIDGDIPNIKESLIEAHKGDDTTPVRMVCHFNGIDSENYPNELKPYLEMLHDKTGERNTIEDIYYRIVPCFTFRYRNVVTSRVSNGVMVDPYRQPELVLTIDSSGQKMVSNVKDSIKNIGRFFGSISKSGAFKDKEDLRRTVRLLIAIAVADGIVGEEEKQTLTLAIRNIEQLTDSECNELLKLLSSPNSSFLTDSDFQFHNKSNGEETLLRMQDIAGSDGEVQDEEREIIERLRLSL